MTMKRKIKILIDLAMTVMLPVLMSYQMVGEKQHEWIGISMFLLFLFHHLLNRQWYKNLFCGRYNKVRVFGTIMDFLLLVDIAWLAFSGIMMSKHVFTFLALDSRAVDARIIHMLAAYWGFAMMSIHIGMHWNTFWVFLKKLLFHKKESAKRDKCLIVITAALCIYGIFVFVKRQIGDYMLLRTKFVFFDFEEPLFFFLLDYFVIMILFGCLGYYMMRLLAWTEKRHKNG